MPQHADPGIVGQDPLQANTHFRRTIGDDHLPGIRAESGFHNGGGLRIGPDDKLYVSVGDNAVGTGGPAPGTIMSPYPQDLTTLEGKILRLELDGGIPADNPFAGMPVRTEIFAYGFRNPWRFGFDPVTEALWAGDVGEETVEEIDLVVYCTGYRISFPFFDEGLISAQDNRLPLYRRVESDAELLEFRCVEFVEELIYGEFSKDAQ